MWRGIRRNRKTNEKKVDSKYRMETALKPPTCKSCKKPVIVYAECSHCKKFRICLPCDNTTDKMRWVEINEKEVYCCYKCIEKNNLRDPE